MIDGNVPPGLASCHGRQPRARTAAGGGGEGAEDLNFIGAAANQFEQSLHLDNIQGAKLSPSTA